MVVPHYDITIEHVTEEQERNDVGELLLRIKGLFPNLKSSFDINVERFTVSTSNRVFRAQTPHNTVMVRIYGNGSSLSLDRYAEVNFIRQWSGTLTATLYCTFNNGYVISYIEGDVMTLEQMREPKFAELIAKKTAFWHTSSSIPYNPSERQGIWVTIYKWLQIASKTVPAAKVAIAAREIEHMEQLIKKEYSDSMLVLGHNDLNFGNFVYNNNAENDDSALFFVDYEYAGYNFREFDLGNHFVEYGGLHLDFSKYPNREVRRKFVIDYLNEVQRLSKNGAIETAHPTIDEETINKMLTNCERFAQVSHLLWHVWGLVIHYSNQPVGEFDYLDYAGKRFAEYTKRKEERKSEIYGM